MVDHDQQAVSRDWRTGAWLLARRYPETYNLRRLKPDRLERVAPAPATGPAPGIDKDGAAELLKVMDKSTPIGRQLLHMTSREEIAQPSDSSLTHTLPIYWRKL
jgi:hypothetical protein